MDFDNKNTLIAVVVFGVLVLGFFGAKYFGATEVVPVAPVENVAVPPADTTTPAPEAIPPVEVAPVPAPVTPAKGS